MWLQGTTTPSGQLRVCLFASHDRGNISLLLLSPARCPILALWWQVKRGSLGMGPLGGLVLLYSTGFLRYAKLANAYASPPGAKAFGYGKGFTRFSDI